MGHKNTMLKIGPNNFFKNILDLQKIKIRKDQAQGKLDPVPARIQELVQLGLALRILEFELLAWLVVNQDITVGGGQ